MNKSADNKNQEEKSTGSYFPAGQSEVLREIIDSMPYGAAYLDPELKIRIAGMELRKLTGMEEDDLAGKSIQQIWGAKCAESITDELNKSGGGTVQVSVLPEASAEKTEKSRLSFTLKPVRNSGDQYGYILTVSPLKSLFTGNEELFTVINSLPLALFLRDISVFEKPVLIYINEAARKLYNISDTVTLEEISITGFMSEGENNRVKMAEITESLKLHGEASFEIEAVSYTGRAFPAEGFTKIIRLNQRPALLTVIKDISRRKENEQNLRLRDIRNEAVLESATDGFIIINEAGEITYTNSAYSELTGYSRDEITGKSVFDFDVSGDHEKPAALKKDLLEKGFARFESVHSRKDGSHWDADISIRLLMQDDGMMIFGFIRDISGRKLTERTIMENERRMRVLLDAVPDLIFRIKRDGTYIDFKANENDLFLKPEMFLGKKMRDVLPPDIAEICHNELEKAFLKSEVHVFEYTLPMPDGRHYYEARVNADPLSGESVMIIRDQTEKKLAEEELKLSNGLINLTNSIAKIGGWQHDLSTGKTQWTDEIARIFEIEAAVNLSVYEIKNYLMPDSAIEFLSALEAVKTTGQPYNLDLSVLTGEGNRKWVRAIGEPVVSSAGIEKIRGTFQDISLEKDNELKYELERKRLRTLVETLPDVVVVKDPQGAFLFCNKQFELLYGHTENELLGKTDFDFVPAEQAQFYKELDDYAYESNSTIHNTEVVKYVTDGRSAVLHTIKTPLVNSAGQKYALLTIGRDITDQYKNEQKLKKEHDYVVNILETMSDAFVALDRFDRYTYINSNACDIFGKTRLDILGRVMWEEFPALVESPFETSYREAINTGKPVVHEEYFEPMKKWFENFINPRKDGVLVFFRDITEKKLAALKIESERRRLRTLIETMPDLVWLKDPDGKYVLCNHQFEKIMGIKEDELRGKSDFDILDEETAGIIRKNDREAFDKNGPVTNIEMVTPAGRIEKRIFEAIKTPVYDAGGEYMGVLGIARDITDLLKMNEALRESEQRLKEAQKIGKMGYWVYNASDKELIWSDEMYRIFEVEKSEFGFTFEDFIKTVHPEDRASFEALFRDSFSEKGEHSTVHRLLLGNERIKFIQAKWVNETGSDGTLIRSLGTSQDITAQKLAEDEILSLNQNLEEKVRQRTRELENLNREMESFAYSVSHDLRAPLRAINGFSSIISDDFADQLPEDAKKYFGRIRANTTRMGEMIDDILALSKITRNPMRKGRVNITALINEICDYLKESAPGRVIEFHVQDGIEVTADRGLIRNVFENLLSNAVKFTSKKEKAVIEAGAAFSEEGTEIFIRDNGAGFDMAYYDKLFGVFQRLHDAGEFPGTGVGLATVQRIMNRHGGTIRAESMPGAGTTFYLFFKNNTADEENAEQ